MNEIPNDPRAFLFAEVIGKKKIPLEQRNITDFVNLVLNANPPDGFLERLIQCMQYIDKPTFNKHLQWMKNTAEQIIGNEPYYIAVSSDVKSNYWIYQQLIGLGLKQAEKTYCGISTKKRMDDLYRMPKEVPVGSTVIFPDDFIITGDSMELLLEDLDNENKLNKHILVYASTPKSTAFLQQRYPGISVHSRETIKTFGERLTENDIDFINQLNKSAGMNSYTTQNGTLFWTWYKAHDSMAAPFYSLIGSKKLTPPYKKDR